MNGVTHLSGFKMIKQYAEYKKLPMPGFGVVISGLAWLIGGLAILLGVYIQLGIWLLIIFLLGAAFKFHDFWNEADFNVKMAQQAHFAKNIALAASLLVILGLLKISGDNLAIRGSGLVCKVRPGLCQPVPTGWRKFIY